MLQAGFQGESPEDATPGVFDALGGLVGDDYAGKLDLHVISPTHALQNRPRFLRLPPLHKGVGRIWKEYAP